MELQARITLFAGAAAGYLGKRLESQIRFARDADPQVYGIGIKELWEIKPEKYVKGRVTHTAGWLPEVTPTADRLFITSAKTSSPWGSWSA